MVELARKVLKNSVYNTLRALISGVGGFIFSIVLARILTPEQFGIYALVISICFLLMQLDFGTGYTAVRYISYALGKRDIELAGSYFKFFLKLRFLLGVTYTVILLLFSDLLAIDVFNKPQMALPLKIVAIFMFFYFVTDYIDCCFQAFQEFKYPAIRHAIYEASRFAFVIPFAFLFFNGVFIGLCLASVLTFFIMFTLLYKRHSYIFKHSNVVESSRVLRFMSFVSIGGISAVIFSYVDMIMLGIFLPAEYAGYYKVATNIIFGIVGLTAGIVAPLFPVFTQLEGDDLKNTFRRAFRYSSIISFPVAVSIAYFSSEIIKVVYGENYLPAYLPLVVLSPLIIFVSTNFFGFIFGAKEKPEYGAAIITLSMLINVILNYVLILKLGMIGAAIATTVSRFFNYVISGITAWKKFKIYPSVDLIFKPVFSSLAMYLFLSILPHPENLLIGFFELLIAFAFYFAVMFLIRGINVEDLRYAKAIIGIESITCFKNK